MKLITLLLTTFLSTFLSTSAYSDHHGNVPVGSGAFVALMVQAQDPDAYVEALKKNPAPFKAIGSNLAGACITKTGHDYPGQMFIYNAFDSIEEAMAATDKYDPMKTTPELTAIREVQYTVMFKPLKQFTLEPGSERLWRLNISNQNLQPFTKKIVELETALRAAGHKVNLGIFQPIGGGVHETIHLRAVSPSYGESGKIIDDAFADADWINTWQEALALVDEVRSDNFEQCELIYTAE
jgi:hypothetical protein|tara:strand:+ start:325 stop:1041 length:717 start_codon:yes stop_codon:yes gene_type:complete